MEMGSSKKIADEIKAGRIRILEQCPAGPFYHFDPGRRRITFYLKLVFEELDFEAFSAAYQDTNRRFPHLRKGILQIGETYYYIENTAPSVIWEGGTRIKLCTAESGYRAFAVLADRNTVILAGDHALFDGGPFMRFVDYMIWRYRVHTGAAGEDMVCDESEAAEEEADVFLLPCGGEWLPYGGLSTRPWGVKNGSGTLDDLICLTVSTKEVLTLCRQLGTSPSALMALLIAEAVEKVFPETKDEHFVLNCPIDYRGALGEKASLKNAAFSVFIDIHSEEWKGMDFARRAKELREKIRQYKDVRYARGMLLFYRAYRELSDPAVEKAVAQSESMSLTYVRPSLEGIYDGVEMMIAGSAPATKFTNSMVEYGGNFHLCIRPSFGDVLLPALLETFEAHGLPSVRFSKETAQTLESEHPVVSAKELPQTVFFFVSPAPGHAGELLPVMRSFVKRGFLVRVYTGEEMRREVEEAGAVCIAYDSFYKRGYAPEDAAWGFLRMLELADSMDYMVGRDIRALTPVCAVVDTQSIWGRLLAEKHGVRVVLSSATQVMNLFTIAKDWLGFFKQLEPWDDIIDEGLANLARRGFPHRTLLSLLCPGNDTDVIAYIPETMQGQLQTLQRERVYFAGYSRYIAPRKRGERAGGGTPEKRPLIYVTTGTVSGRSSYYFKQCASAFGEMDADVVMAVSKRHDPGHFAPVPSNIRIVREADREALLRQADLMVCHAGLDAISDALLLGVPMVMYPMEADQFGNAKRVEALGAGIRVDDCEPGTIRRAVETVLSDASCRERAAALGEDMRTYKGAEGAVDWMIGRW